MKRLIVGVLLGMCALGSSQDTECRPYSRSAFNTRQIARRESLKKAGLDMRTYDPGSFERERQRKLIRIDTAVKIVVTRTADTKNLVVTIYDADNHTTSFWSDGTEIGKIANLTYIGGY